MFYIILSDTVNIYDDIECTMFFFFFFKQKTAYEMLRSLVGSEMCIRDRFTAALGNAGLAVSWILDTLDHLPNHTTFADKQKPGASTRWLAVEMVQLPCQIEGLGSSLDMCTALNKDDAVVVSLEEFATMED
eukprot:TRINITY_DN2504_c0_g1_i9.p1 TRINITY_DN2504_c0_g1~~TRINITY_DN2504_c0_g1_i9.p1  ORF type:complete len:132 (+),score=39.21 TRINITY_DN2504_c0_g1_i9:20-415(+)